MPAELPVAATAVAVDLGSKGLDALMPYIQAHPLATYIIGGLLALHFVASLYVASTETKSGKLYKAAEVVALVTAKAKGSAKT